MHLLSVVVVSQFLQQVRMWENFGEIVMSGRVDKLHHKASYMTQAVIDAAITSIRGGYDPEVHGMSSQLRGPEPGRLVLLGDEPTEHYVW